MSMLMNTYKTPSVNFVAGEGVVLTDVDGREYLDFLAGLAVVSLGHAHPAVAQALSRQAATLLHVSNLFGSVINEEVATTLDRLVGDGKPAGGKVFFANSGAEANECAFKLARRFCGRGRHGVISAFGSFHGRTLATLHATGQPAKHEPFAPLPEGFRHVVYGDIGALAAAATPSTVGAIVLEVIEAEGGVIPAPAGYLRAVRSLCDERGILLIVDEVQTGLARTGRWFGFHHEAILPDIVTMAKALGNGVPVGACWAKSEVADVFTPGDHGTTYGGQPLAMSAARAVLSTMIAIDAPRLARERGAYLRDAIVKIPGVIEVRGLGLLLGAILEDGLDSAALVEEALRRGLVVNAPAPGVIRFAPPLIVSEEQIDAAAVIIGDVIADERKRGNA
ncbi:MAG TPA: acetylornithine/succinylornithine family transaminase [Acidimicrobiales bacterium]|jgi:predicted acetylornithine/succinylornithine family transaminase|nr:acetylornithine/succinylornithine family transaminase [Acidimicrobiales bacterium]